MMAINMHEENILVQRQFHRQFDRGLIIHKS